MKKLKEQLWPIVLEYTRQVCEVMECSNWHWVGTNDHGDCVCETLGLNDGSYFLNWSDVQVIVDNLDEWVKRYGSKEAVGDEIRAWEDWWTGDDEQYRMKDAIVIDELFGDRRKRFMHTYPRINLESWLRGCPRDEDFLKPSIHERVMAMRQEVEILSRIGREYRTVRNIDNVIENIRAKIKFLEAKEKARENRATRPGE